MGHPVARHMGSSAVEGYVRSAHLKRAEKWARTINSTLDLEVMASEVKAQGMQ